ncbi:MAG: phage capsid protein [Pseudomonadota bacterium]|uniref:major capsid protein n=1 Tax=Halopseudomonas aestusnigri TaxID=857252 RepID=UPI001D185B03|nr:phage capsid protein [Halopseudomonas aestusnigri]MCC4260786.1 phage capsid protein [Halopseudomonas aestusnigri]MCK5529688.1 phage capsid protein [Halopseudomonas aestusnigri]MEC7472462.1 phage capsid protein [Pseudomonadota bacterium]|tara:strand:+ start:473 stop:1468 length:996 start_codon:yes stop_codon:yes gene_type:complete
MGILTSTMPTLLDKFSREDSQKKIMKIVELMAKQNDILNDAEYQECNDGSKHKTTMRSGIPEPAWRQFNAGVQPSKSTTVPVIDTTGMMEDYGKVDKALADLSGNADAFRVSENMAKLQGFNNKAARYMFYGNTESEPESFLGLAPRYNDLSAESGANIVDAGGTGSTNASIWFVTWGEMTTHLLYPKGSVAGFKHQNLGEDTVSDGNGGEFQAYRDHFKWDIGLSVRDWRANARIANIDVTALTKDGATGADLIELMVDAYYLIDNSMQADGRTVIYCNRTIQTFLHKQAMNAKNVNLTIGEYAGKKIPEFLGMPIKRCDALLNTEARVV